MPRLEDKRLEAYAQGLFLGMKQRDAFLSGWPSYKKNKDSTIDSKASHVRDEHPEIDDRLEELREEAWNAKVMGVSERMAELSSIARNEDVNVKSRIMAIDTLNKMDGTYLRASASPAPQGVTIIDDIGEDHGPEISGEGADGEAE